MENKAHKTDVLHKEIDLIQSCITRMGQNSFLTKGWLITILSVILVFLPESIDIKGLCIFGVIITVCFWYLDAFFLKMEKLYRWKYEWVIECRSNNDFYKYDLNPYNKDMWLSDENNHSQKKEPFIGRVMLSKTLLPLYGVIMIRNCYEIN